ncbi:MAG: hypothetical protein B6D58_07260 [candidate division Zixibacteria bacterium 4484_95]|nr:MAG: hypothetical protein B6D58_07260 [candidate division Zixibacteria bacterium 4484_95]RKX20544.1 MAG: hypothetical protein DRP26_01485 [candidate division Zixibacteria bacterium]
MAESKSGETQRPVFTENDIKAIARVLNNAEVLKLQDHWRMKVINAQEKRHLSVDIYPVASLSEKKQGALIAVYAQNSHLQLHCCRGFVISEELGEVTFVGDANGKLSGLVVEKEAACSLYANADKDLLSGDFTKLGVEVMLSGVALSLAEDILEKKE